MFLNSQFGFEDYRKVLHDHIWFCLATKSHFEKLLRLPLVFPQHFRHSFQTLVFQVQHLTVKSSTTICMHSRFELTLDHIHLLHSCASIKSIAKQHICQESKRYWHMRNVNKSFYLAFERGRKRIAKIYFSLPSLIRRFDLGIFGISLANAHSWNTNKFS